MLCFQVDRKDLNIVLSSIPNPNVNECPRQSRCVFDCYRGSYSDEPRTYLSMFLELQFLEYFRMLKTKNHDYRFLAPGSRFHTEPPFRHFFCKFHDKTGLKVFSRSKTMPITV